MSRAALPHRRRADRVLQHDTAPTLVPASARVLGMLVAARDALYFQGRAQRAATLETAHGAAAAERWRCRCKVTSRCANAAARGRAWRHDGLLMRWRTGHTRHVGWRSTLPGRCATPACSRRAPMTRRRTSRPPKFWCAAMTAPGAVVHRAPARQVLDGRAPTLLQAMGRTASPGRRASTRRGWPGWSRVRDRDGQPRGSGVFGQACTSRPPGEQAQHLARHDRLAEYLIAQGWASHKR